MDLAISVSLGFLKSSLVINSILSMPCHHCYSEIIPNKNCHAELLGNMAYLHVEAMLALNTIICPYVQPPVHMPALAVGVCELNFIGCLGLWCHTLVIGHLCCQLTPVKTSYSLTSIM